mmetsp:Transcript_173137/g.555181  ORF Transcript_173137/g.555181 Transcript_173137/m.555181 type:complete len:389 (-) Transcript_173137:3315-4481(-)
MMRVPTLLNRWSSFSELAAETTAPPTSVGTASRATGMGSLHPQPRRSGRCRAASPGRPHTSQAASCYPRAPRGCAATPRAAIGHRRRRLRGPGQVRLGPRTPKTTMPERAADSAAAATLGRRRPLAPAALMSSAPRPVAGTPSARTRRSPSAGVSATGPTTGGPHPSGWTTTPTRRLCRLNRPCRSPRSRRRRSTSRATTAVAATPRCWTPSSQATTSRHRDDARMILLASSPTRSSCSWMSSRGWAASCLVRLRAGGRTRTRVQTRPGRRQAPGAARCRRPGGQRPRTSTRPTATTSGAEHGTSWTGRASERLTMVTIWLMFSRRRWKSVRPGISRGRKLAPSAPRSRARGARRWPSSEAAWTRAPPMATRRRATRRSRARSPCPPS